MHSAEHWTRHLSVFPLQLVRYLWYCYKGCVNCKYYFNLSFPDFTASAEPKLHKYINMSLVKDLDGKKCIPVNNVFPTYMALVWKIKGHIVFDCLAWRLTYTSAYTTWQRLDKMQDFDIRTLSLLLDFVAVRALAFSQLHVLWHVVLYPVSLSAVIGMV